MSFGSDASNAGLLIISCLCLIFDLPIPVFRFLPLTGKKHGREEAPSRNALFRSVYLRKADLIAVVVEPLPLPVKLL